MKHRTEYAIPKRALLRMRLDERQRVAAILNDPAHPQWTAEQRRVQVLAGDRAQHKFMSAYYLVEALRTLEAFAAQHYEAAPSKYGSPVGDRLRRFYPNLCYRLRDRLDPMFEIEEFAPYKPRFEKLEKKYLAGLRSADDLARDFEGAKKRNQRHEGYLQAFGNIYPQLKALLTELVEIGNSMQMKRP